MGTRILQISDLHFGPPLVQETVNILREFIPGLDVDIITITGDLTQRAKRSQFIAAKEFLDSLPPVPKLVVPGNHDIPLYRILERIINPLGLYREVITPDLNPVLILGKIIIVGLDSTAPLRTIANGRLHPPQLKHCEEVFKNAPADAFKIIALHHHFAMGPDHLHDRPMPKAKRAINTFVDYGVDLILGGHLHRSYLGNSLDFFPGNHRDQGIIISQCGTTTSSRGRGRERGENTFNLIDVEEETFSITHYMYFEKIKQFAPLSKHIFPRPEKTLQLKTL